MEGGGPPVVVVDLGAGLGRSMVRLAQQHKSEIEAGNLILVCASISHEPNFPNESKMKLEEGISVAQWNEEEVPGYYVLLPHNHHRHRGLKPRTVFGRRWALGGEWVTDGREHEEQAGAGAIAAQAVQSSRA
jgi:hypothetical protein